MTATGVEEPEDALTDPEESEPLEFESSEEDVVLDESELELVPADDAVEVDAVAVDDDLPGMVWALT